MAKKEKEKSVKVDLPKSDAYKSTPAHRDNPDKSVVKTYKRTSAMGVRG